MELTRHGVKDRMSNDIVYRTKIGGYCETHLRAEKWCKQHIGERGEIIEIKPSEEEKAAAALGRKGGRVKSEKKAASCRENGKKGGRPRKVV